MTYKGPVRFSGFRINFLPENARAVTWQRRFNEVGDLIPILQEAMGEPYFVDDTFRERGAGALLQHVMANGELFKCFHDGKLAGVIILEDIIPGREATLDAWTAPEFRGKYPCARFIKDVLNYAFRAWNPESTEEEKKAKKGLGLLKIKAHVCPLNLAAIRALGRLGFAVTGRSPYDGLFKQQWTDMLLVEKLNPNIFNQLPPEEISDGRQESNTDAGDSDLPAAGTVHTGTATDSAGSVGTDLRSASDDGGADRDGGGGLREDAKPLPTARLRKSALPEREPAGPSGPGQIRGELLSAIRKSGNSASSSRPVRKRTKRG